LVEFRIKCRVGVGFLFRKEVRAGVGLLLLGERFQGAESVGIAGL
jgi:hypothetical protein